MIRAGEVCVPMKAHSGLYVADIIGMCEHRNIGRILAPLQEEDEFDDLVVLWDRRYDEEVQAWQNRSRALDGLIVRSHEQSIRSHGFDKLKESGDTIDLEDEEEPNKQYLEGP